MAHSGLFSIPVSAAFIFRSLVTMQIQPELQKKTPDAFIFLLLLWRPCCTYSSAYFTVMFYTWPYVAEVLIQVSKKSTQFFKLRLWSFLHRRRKIRFSSFLTLRQTCFLHTVRTARREFSLRKLACTRPSPMSPLLRKVAPRSIRVHNALLSGPPSERRR